MSYKFQRLREKLREVIKSGEFTGKLPGERALAKRFHVNAKTLSKALTDLAAEGLLDRSIGRGTYVKGSEPTVASRGRWLVFCDEGSEDSCLIAGLRRTNNQLHVESIPVNADASASTKLRPSFLNQFCAVIDIAGRTPEHVLRDLVVRNIPVVAVGREPKTFSTHAVLADQSLGAARLGRDLLIAGHRRLAAVEPAGSSAVAFALSQAAARYAHSTNSLPAVIDSLNPNELSALLGAGDANAPTAAVCASTVVANELRQQTAARGLAIPANLSLCAVGCSCASEACQRTSCTGYFVECAELVDSIVGLLGDSNARPTTLWLSGQFHDRGTTSPYFAGGELFGPVVCSSEGVAAPAPAMLSLALGGAPA